MCIQMNRQLQRHLLRAGEMAQWLKHLLCKLVDCTLIPRTCEKLGVAANTYNRSGPAAGLGVGVGGQRSRDRKLPRSSRPASLAYAKVNRCLKTREKVRMDTVITDVCYSNWLSVGLGILLAPLSISLQLHQRGLCCHNWLCVGSGHPNSNPQICKSSVLSTLPSPGGLCFFVLFFCATTISMLRSQNPKKCCNFPRLHRFKGHRQDLNSVQLQSKSGRQEKTDAHTEQT